MKKEKLYCIHWCDTFGQLRWRDEAEIKKMAVENPEYIQTVGYFIGKFGDYTCIAASKNTHPEMCDWGGITFIPTGTIKKIKLLR